MFLGLVKNELIKIFAKKKTYIILLLFVALSVVIAVIAQKSEESYLQSIDPAYKIENIEREIGYQAEYLEYIKKNTEMTEADKKRELDNNASYMTSLETDLAAAKALLESNKTYDWVTDANEQLVDLKEQLIATDDQQFKIQLEQQIQKLEVHLENNIPINEENLNTGFNYLKLSITVIMSGFLAFGLILFSGDVMSGEYNPGTLKFLLIQPVTRIKVLLSKYLVTVAASTGLILGFQVLFALGVGIVKGFGSVNLPLFIGQKFEAILQNGEMNFLQIKGTGNFIGQGEYLLRGLFLEVLLIATMVAFVTMISVVTKSTVISFTVLIATLLGTNILYTLSTTYRQVSAYIFLHHTNIDGILSGNVIMETHNLNFTYSLSIIVLLVSCLAFLGIAMTVFKKRDILI
ncbi:MAG: ABC transporter permease subunit [Clostridiaceae bacterium]